MGACLQVGGKVNLRPPVSRGLCRLEARNFQPEVGERRGALTSQLIVGGRKLGEEFPGDRKALAEY